MFHLPPIPGWEGLHPLVVHFPIVLLMVTPLFLLGAVVCRRWSGVMIGVAVFLSVLGTVAASVAVETGEAAGEIAERTPTINAVLERHEDGAETVRNVFIVLTLLLAARLAAPRWIARLNSAATATALDLALLALYGAATLPLINTAHLGGRLVHEFGVHSLVADAPADSAAREPDDD